MNPLITGTFECTKCKYKFNWHYIVAQHGFSNAVVVSIPNNSRGTKVIKEISNKVYLFQARCPRCDEILEFEQEVDESINHF